VCRWSVGFAGGAAVEAVAASWLTDGGSKQQRRCSVFSVFSRDPLGLVFLKFSTLPSSSYVFLVFFLFLPFPLFSRSVFFLCFFLFFSPLGSLFFRVSLLLFPPSGFLSFSPSSSGFSFRVFLTLLPPLFLSVLGFYL